MAAAEDFAAFIHAVANDAAIAMRATRRHGFNGAFETIKGFALTSLDDFERLVIVVAA
jgi:hypothetical protein